jgi:hypothetical protein
VAIVLLLLGGAVLHSALQPRPFNWWRSYHPLDRSPYGTYVLFDQLLNFFPEHRTKRYKREDFDQYWETMQFTHIGDESDSTYGYSLPDTVAAKPFNIFLINNSFLPGEQSTAALLQHVKKGNHAMIAADAMDSLFLSRWGLTLDTLAASQMSADSLDAAFDLRMQDNSQAVLSPFAQLTYFSRYTSEADILMRNAHGQVLALAVAEGQGQFIFCTLPLAFTNYNLLKKDRMPAAYLIRQLPEADTYWTQSLSDPYQRDYADRRSLLAFVHSQEALTWAFYTLVTALLLYFIFQVKRRQRAIPLLEPPTNASVGFAEMLGNLYYDSRDHKGMLQKKMKYFLMQVRDRYRIDTTRQDERFMKLLASKTAVQPDAVHELFETYRQYAAQEQVSAQEFLKVNKCFQVFKQL